MRRADGIKSLLAGLTGAAGLLGAQPAAAQTPVIGNVAAANQAVIGTPPDATQRQLQLGFEVNALERIQTAEIGAGQFVFLDQTTLSVWPNSDIVLDKYVYDPNRGVGEMSVTLTRGVLRFIGGRISKGADAEIRTPQGLVTVRGGIAQIVTSDRVTRATHIAGEYTRLGDITLSRPNAVAEARLSEAGQIETRFLGVLDAEGVAALFGQQQGEGTGGLEAAPGDAQVGAGLSGSGAEQRGSGDPQAPSRPPVSTLGEQPRSEEAPQSPEQPAQTDRQIVLGERVRTGDVAVTPVDPTPVDPTPVDPTPVGPTPVDPTPVDPRPVDPTPVVPAPVDPTPVDPAPVVPAPVDPAPVVPAPVDPMPVDPTPVGPPVDPMPVDPPPVDVFSNPVETMITGLDGLNLFAGTQSMTLDNGVVVSSPFGQQVIFLGNNGTGLTAFSLLSYLVQDSFGGVETFEFLFAQNVAMSSLPATALLNQGVIFGLTNDFFLLPADVDTGGAFTGDALVGDIDGLLNGAPALVQLFGDPGVFTLATFAAQDAIGLSFFGAPTPASFWDQAVGGGTVLFIDYDITDAFFSGVSAPLPTQLGDPFANADRNSGTPGLLLISSQFGAFRGASPRALAGLLDVAGEGPAQSSVFGVFTGTPLRPANGQLVISAPAFLTTRLAAQSGVAVAQVQLGSIVAGEAASFGPAGEFIVLGSVQNTVVQGELVSTPLPNRYLDQSSGPQSEPLLYGDTRLATADLIDFQLAGDRTPIGAGPVPFSAANPAVTSALTGGYATNVGNFSRPDGSGGLLVSQPYRLTSFGPDSVRIGFAPSLNGVVAELSGLSDVDDAGLFEVNLNFGALDGRDALLNDAVFGLQEAEAPSGPLTGQSQTASSSAGRPAIDGQQQAFAGGFASSGLAGDGGLVPTGVDATPQFLRWGWWNGEFGFADDEQNTALSGRFDRLHVGPWVSGVVSDIADVNAVTGQVSYDGFAIANVLEQTGAGPATYVESGRFQLDYDFASSASSGSLTLSGFLGQSFTGEVSAVGAFGGNHYAGDLSATGSPNVGSGTVQGAFFTGVGDPVAATAGVFDLSGVTARGNQASAVGVFGADALLP